MLQASAGSVVAFSMDRISLDPNDIGAVIGRIYESAVDPQALADVLACIATRFNAHSALFFTPKLAPPEGGLSYIHNLDTSAFDEYVAHYIDVDIWWHTARAIEVDGETGIVVGEELVDRRSFERSEFYNDYLTKVDTYHVIASDTRIQTHAGAIDLSVAFHGSPRHKGFGDAHKDLLAALLPHLRRAVCLATELAGPMHGATLAADTLEALASGAVVLAANGRVLHANTVAESMLAEEHGIVVRGGCLRANFPKDDAELQTCLQRAAGLAGTPEGSATVVRSIRTGAISIVSVLPIPNHRAVLALNPARILVTIRDPSREPTPRWTLFARHYQLTPAELRICQALARGISVKEYCESESITENTARTHLKSVFSKTDARRQTDLVAIMNAFA